MFIQQATQLFLDRVVAHPLFRTTQGFQDFIKSEFKFFAPLSPPMRRQKSKSFFSFGSPAPLADVDVYFEDAKKEMNAFESHMSAFGRVNERIAIVKRGISSHVDLGKSIVETSTRLNQFSNPAVNKFLI